MKDWKKWLRLPWWALLLLTAVSTAGLTIVFAKGWEESWIAYIVYVLSFYTLSAVCFACAAVFPRWYRAAKQKVYDNRYGNRYLTDVAFKTHVSLYLSLGMNLMYIAVNTISMLLYRSAWFTILAFYYSILAVMRFLLVRYVNQNQIGSSRVGELKRSRCCGWILLAVNLFLTGAVPMILYRNRGFQYHGMLIYVMALYTFYVTTHAVVDIVKYRKYNSPVMSTAKIITLSAALVSMLSLETAMFSQFGAEMAAENKRIMIAATGAGVSLVVLALSMWLIVRATREIRHTEN